MLPFVFVTIPERNNMFVYIVIETRSDEPEAEVFVAFASVVEAETFVKSARKFDSIVGALARDYLNIEYRVVEVPLVLADLEVKDNA